MMIFMQPIDMTGQRVGKWTVHSRAPGRQRSTKAYWNCVCDCGAKAIVEGVNLRSDGGSRGCRSCMNTKHGLVRLPAYRSWIAMMARCRTHQSYIRRGITVCERWHDPVAFIADMGERPPGTEIDRINNGKGYYPGNCHWVTRKKNSRNRSTNRMITVKGETMCVMDAAVKYGVPHYLITHRLNRGWPHDMAVLPSLRS